MTYILNKASKEQHNIINSLRYKNVIVDAVAGSGKTTTVLHIANQYSNKILLLTYNKKLRLETKQKAQLLGLYNIDVWNYHAFCCKYYDHKCYTDNEIRRTIKNGNEPMYALNYDYVILDEAQDITPLYYELIFKIINNNYKIPKLCVLGDRFQSIYKFNNADERFIIYADKLFDLNVYKWEKTKLSTSFRLTRENANFLNNCVLGDNRIKTVKCGPKPRYIICDCFGDKYGTNSDTKTFDEVVYYLRRYNAEDIFILAPSVKSEKSPVRQLANKLSNNGISVYVPNNDEEQLDEDILRGKIVFSTFHQSKGLERKVVILFNFDSSYFKYYKKECNPMMCPNEMYVALTRVIECMTIFHHYQNDYIGFLNKARLKQCCYFEEYTSLDINNNKKEKETHKIAVTDLIRHLPSHVLEHAMIFIETKQIKEKQEKINIQVKTKQGDLYENVSEITGTAIPAYYELMNKHKMTIYNCIARSSIYIETGPSDYAFINDTSIESNDIESEEDDAMILENIDIYNLSIEELLFIANHYCAYTSGYNYKLNQIKYYDWLSVENLEKCYDRLDSIISKKAVFEKKVEVTDRKELLNKGLVGFIDCVDGCNVFEFKCVTELKQEHFIQLAIYAYINEITNEIMNGEINEKSNRYFLYNILDDEMHEVLFSLDNLKDMVEYLIYSKYYNTKQINDKEFLDNMFSRIDIYGLLKSSFLYVVDYDILYDDVIQLYNDDSNRFKGTCDDYKKFIKC